MKALPAICLFGSLICPAPAAAQSPAVEPAPAAATPGWLTRSDFHISASKLSINDIRFWWDAHIGGSIDIVDYGDGRFVFLADYEPVLGREFRAFDPNQGNYTLEGSFSYRAPAAEIAFVFHHVSRHLGDRANTRTIAWNVTGGRILKSVTAGPMTLNMRADAGLVINHTFADYTWTSDLHLELIGPVGTKKQGFVRGTAELYGVDPSKVGRGMQNGGHIEGGVRLEGKGAAIELFLGFERRVDAYPLDRSTLKWIYAGFRLSTR